MSMSEPETHRDVLQRALLAVKDLRARLAIAEHARTEPIAIVGIGCRFPGGVRDPESFWSLLSNGVDATGDVPRDRWDAEAYYDLDPQAAGKIYTKRGGFLDEVDRFDATFFRIAPREAVHLDPQHRLVLEVAWEALERAGQTRGSLDGSRTGVFIGITTGDYGQIIRRAGATELDAYVPTGNAFNAAAGRLSHLLGLQGPSMAVDAACASSLVAVHLACQSLHTGDCQLALAGGVNLMLDPGAHIAMSRAHALAPDGRCKTFDVSADGYGRGEGCGLVVLERLSDAIAARDPILAVIRGSAVMHDGHSGGLTVPNGAAQQAVIRAALGNAGVAPAEVGYIEAHGTGTSLGDPIEVRALGAVFGPGRSAEHPLVLGSVKTNIGHLEAAAGVAGLIKAVLALQHREIPPHLHLHELNPDIAQEPTPKLIPVTATPWPNQGPRIAGVSAFGLSGTIAHVVVEEAPVEASTILEVAAEPDDAVVLPISAHSPEALRELAAAYHQLMSRPDAPPPGDLGYAAAVRRTHHDHRLAVVGASHTELADGLAAFLAAESRNGLAVGVRTASTDHKLVFVFPGQGGQWPGMAQDLLAREPVFAAAIATCDAALRPHVDWSVRELLAASPAPPALDQIDVLQPALFAIQVALVALWRSLGIEPHAVVGHSLGEVAAAHVAGALSLDDAARIIARRSRLLRTIRGQGAMAVVELSLADARRALAGRDDRLAIAASNGPTTTVVSGDPTALTALVDELAGREVFCRPVKVDVASHSPQVDILCPALAGALAGLAPRTAAIPFHSTVTGALADGRELDGDYWVRNLRQPVLFAPTIERLVAQGHDLFVEMSPHPVLAGALQQILRGHGDGGAVLASLRRDEPGRAVVLAALGALYTTGYPVDWSRQYPAPRRLARLPSYPWQRERYWVDAPEAGAQPDAPWPSSHASPPSGDPRPSIRSHAGLADAPLLAARTRERPDTPCPAEPQFLRTLSSLAPEKRGRALERHLCDHAAGVLGLRGARIAVEQPLRDLGLDSLMTLELRNRIEASLGLRLSATVIWNHPTIASLAEHLACKLELAPGAAPAVLRVPPGASSDHTAAVQELPKDEAPGNDVVERAPLSAGQERLWFIERMVPDSCAYNVAASFRIDGEIDAARFTNALEAVVRRHSPLRAAVDETGDRPCLQIAHNLRPHLDVIDLRGRPQQEAAAVWRELLDRDANTPFDLARAPLLRVRLFLLNGACARVTLVVHHMVFDGWSLTNFVTELLVHHEAGDAGLPPLRADYSSFARWQNGEETSALFARQLAFWRARLSTTSHVLELPADRPRPRLQSFRGRLYRFEVAAEVAGRIRAVAEAGEATVYHVLLSVLAVLLHRYTEQSSFAIGTPMANRARSEYAKLIGYFVNVLPIPVEIGPQLSFRDLLAQLRRTSLEALDNQDVPFGSIVDALQPKRDLGRGVLCQVLLALQSATKLRVREGGLAAELGIDDVGLTRYDLELHFLTDSADSASAGSGAMSGVANYCTDLFEHSTIERFVRHYLNVLAEATAHPDRTVSQFAVLSPDEIERQVQVWNDTRASTSEAAIHELFEARALAQPDAIAVEGDGRTITYDELDRRASRVARALGTAGVARADRVAVLAGRSIEIVAGLLGALKAGTCYVPLEADHPDERLRWILQAVKARALLTVKRYRDRVAALAPGTAIILLDDDRLADGGDGDDDPPVQRVDPDSDAYIIFTSGSTGAPKGVRVAHRPVVNLIEWVNRTFAVGPGDRLLFVTAASFDLSVYDVFGILAAGGVVRVASEAEVRDPEALLDVLVRERITFWDSAPAALQRVAALFPQLEAAGAPPGHHLRLVFLSGDWIPLSLPPRVVERFPEARVIALGGATEATIWSNFFPVENIEPSWRSVPYGRPIQNARYYILDPALRPVPVGVAGDLYIGGECLATDYVDDAKLTARKFLPDPFAARPGARMYATGDRARFFEDGVIEFLGRTDSQIKIRGFRVELGEVEAALARCTGVRACAVLARQRAELDRSLVGFYVEAGRSPVQADEGRLRAELAAQLPAYMVPEMLVAVDAIPTTANGKVDRAALLAHAAAGALAAAGRPAREPPAGPTEVRIAEIWRDVLGLAECGATDDFFRIGGNSMNAVKVTATVRAAFHIALAIPVLFECPTVRSLARRVEHELGVARTHAHEASPAPGEVEEIVPDPAARFEPFPLLDMQQAYWLGADPSFELGLVPHIYFELAWDVEPARFTAALRRVISRHEMLRAVTTEAGYQRILDQVPPYQPPVIDVRGLPPAEAEARMAADRDRCQRTAPSSADWPAYEWTIWLTPAGARVHASINLVFCDGLSLANLLDDLWASYHDPDRELAPLQLSVRDYVLARARRKQGPAFERARQYWLARVPELPLAPRLPLAASPHEISGHRLTARRAFLAPATWRSLQDHARRRGLSPSSAVLAAYAYALATWARGTDFSLVIMYLSREEGHPEVPRLIGNLSTTSVLEVHALSGGQTFTRFCRVLQQQLWEDLEHNRFTGLDVLRELNRHHRGEGRLTLPVTFASGLGLSRADGGQAWRGVGELICLQVPQVWLDHQIYERDDGALEVHWDVAEPLFPPGLMDEMLGAELALLGELSRGERWEVPITTLSPTSWCAADVPPRGEMLHAPFARTARAFPDRVAVIDGSRQVSYGEVDRLSDGVARRLRALGVARADLVAVDLPRGWQEIVGVIGILKAGAAYLPIHPAWPEERRKIVLDLARPRVVLDRTHVAMLDLAEELVPAPTAASDDPTDLAYVIFTSGSTGAPKGVAIEHRSAWNTVDDINRRIQLAPGDRVLALSSLSFDLSVHDIFGALAAGAAVVYPDPQLATDPAHLAELVGRTGVTIWNSVPEYMRIVQEHLDGVAAPAHLDSLRVCMLSGDWIPVDLPDRIRARSPRCQVIGLGGATEASIWSIAYPIGAVDPSWTSIPYGTALRHQSVQVLGESLEPCPIWVVGEIHIGGVGLARCYLGDPELTAARFITHPRTRARLYRTGDLGRLRPDGNIELLGREDNQVKVGGHRIELGDVEAALRRHPAVAAAVVVARGDRQRGMQLVAYYTLAGDLAATPRREQLRDFLRQILPSYMAPRTLVPLEALPTSANGKIDRKALLSMSMIAAEPGAARQADLPPRATQSETENVLRAIWNDVLERDVGPADDFFELGGNSLLAVRVMARIERDLGRRLPASSLLDAPTITDLAQVLDEKGVHARAELLVPIRVSADRPPIFLIHPIGGSVLCYRELADALSGTFSIWGVQAPGLAGHPILDAGVPALADRYLEEISRLHPSGSLFVAGWSFGGIVAFEIARRAALQGRPVRTLLIDSYLVDRGRDGDRGGELLSEPSLVRRFHADLCRVQGKDVPLELAGDRAVVLADVFERASAAGIVPREVTAHQFHDMYEVFRANTLAHAGYVPERAADLDMTVAIVTDPSGLTGVVPAAHWKELARCVRFAELDGDHYNIVSGARVHRLAELFTHDSGACMSAPDPSDVLIASGQCFIDDVKPRRTQVVPDDLAAHGAPAGTPRAAHDGGSSP